MTTLPPELEVLMPNPWQPATRAYPALFTADQVRQAMLDATERAAKKCEEQAEAFDLFNNNRASNACEECAAAIRGGGQG